MVSLKRCMTGLRLMEIKADGAGFRALGAHAMTDGLFGVLRHQLLQFRLCRVVIEIGRAGPAKHPANSAQELEPLMSTIRTASIRGRGGSMPNRPGASP